MTGSIENDSSRECAIKEYEALRAEILARVVMRDQMINYCATIFAAVVAIAAHVGGDTNQTATLIILLAYPPVALIFAHGWATHDLRIWEMGWYILNRISEKVPLANWERWLRDRRKNEDGRRQNWFARGAFVGTSAITILLGIAVGLMDIPAQAEANPNQTQVNATQTQANPTQNNTDQPPLKGPWGWVLVPAILLDVLLAGITWRQIWARSREMQSGETETVSPVAL
jgi:hypothetical protein